MTSSLVLALTLIPAVLAFARTNTPDVQQAVQAPADEKPDAKLLDLEKELAQEQKAKGPARATPEQYNAFVARFRETLAEIMGRVAPTPANRSVYARILARLGDSKRALADLNAALKQDPTNTRLAAAKAYVLFDRKDYAASAAAAKSILSKDPTNQDALWLKHASEDRNAPKLTLPGSPWGAGLDSLGGVVGVDGVAGASNDAAKPYTLAIKVGAAADPPNYVPSSGSNAPPEKRSPLVPLAATGVLLWIGAGLAARRAQDRAVDAAEQGGEAVADKAANLAERGKELVEDHPYASGAAAVAGVLVAGVLAAPLILGGSGPTLLAAGAAGGGAPIAAAAASVAPQTIAAAGAATWVLSVAGDASKSTTGESHPGKVPRPGEEGARSDLKKPSATNPRLQRAIDDLFQSSDRLPGGTANAADNEFHTGEPTGGRWHLQKAADNINRLNRILKLEQLSQADRATAEALRDDLQKSVNLYSTVKPTP